MTTFSLVCVISQESVLIPQLSSAKPTLAFEIPVSDVVLAHSLHLTFIPCFQTNGDSTQQLIYALGSTNPSSSAVNAALVQHADYGIIKLDLTKQATSTASPSDTGSDTGSSSGGIPLRPYEKMIIAHAIFCVVGFLFFLPAGALLARYLRTFVPGPIWFKAHAILQFFIGGL